MDFKNIEELKAKLKEISKKGFIENHREGDDGGVGRTLEDEMDIVENNLKIGDFMVGDEGVELKTQRRKASSRITLSTKEPEWIFDKLETIKKTGYKDVKGRVGLKITLNTSAFNPKGFKLEINKDKICIMHNNVGEVCFFDTQKLIEIIKEKLGENLLFVIADSKKESEKEYFHFIEATYFSEFNEKAFIEMVKSGEIIWEFRLHIKPSGAIRDHGSGFRINRKYLNKLYKKSIILLS